MSEKISSLNLNERLDAFRAEMFAKFKRVEHKHRDNSVTDDSIDWMTFNWDQIEQHLIEEFGEYFNLTKQEIDQLLGLIYRSENRHDSHSEKEAIDLGNMAFLMWWHEVASKQEIEEML